MGIMNFFSNLFNGNAFADVAELKQRTASAESQLATATARANKAEEENAILKSDKVVLADEIVKLKGDLSTKEAAINDYLSEIGRLNDRINELAANQRPPRENGRFVSTKKQAALAAPAATKAKKAAKPKATV